MKKLIRLLSLVTAIAVMMAIAATSASAVTFECDVETYSDSILMVNLDTGIEVFSKDPDTRRYPAALTKIMTYIVAVENIKDLDMKIEIKETVLTNLVNSGMACSGLDWHEGAKLSVTDVLYALMLPRGNDAAMVLADYVGGGDVSAFVRLMNEKAAEIGCENTHFVNPTGVDSADQYTTARDMVKICRYAMGVPLFSKIVSTPSYNLEGDEYPIVTTNSMVDAARGGEYYYTYATGIQNGETESGGTCLAASAICDGYAYLVVCLHAPIDYDEGKEYCMEEAANLFRWAFVKLRFVSPATKDTPICEQPINNAWDTQSILLVPETDLNVVLPGDYQESDITITPDETKAISAPVKKGDVITTATVYYKGEAFRKINLVAHDDVSASPILFFTHGVDKVLTSPWFLIAVALVVILFVVFVSVSSSYNKKKRKRQNP
ncbi:MAG: D-alanyl-D-alanine carboxypeptidase [Ruminococcus sp.]|nr:D-alanyl-D-alanine carboxypeptidase [Ruminococcus sp.]